MESYPLGTGAFTDLERHLTLFYSQQECGVLFNPSERKIERSVAWLRIPPNRVTPLRLQSSNDC